MWKLWRKAWIMVLLRLIIINIRIIYELPPLDSVLSQMDKVLEPACQTLCVYELYGWIGRGRFFV